MTVERTFLTQAEVDQLCEPLTQPAAQRRWLRRSGIPFREAPSGRPVVARSDVQILSSEIRIPQENGSVDTPDVDALMRAIVARRASRQTAQRPSAR